MFRPLLLILCLTLGLAAPSTLYAAKSIDQWTTKYDRYFKKYTKRYFGPHFNWKWFKAQAIAESGLKPKIKSHVGARGLMQIMPATYAEIRSKNRQFLNIEEPQWNIAAGIYYNRGLYRKWRLPALSNLQRLFLTFASYNAGYGRILKAKRRAGGDIRSWKDIEPYAPTETRNYVKRISTLLNGKRDKRKRRLHGIEKWNKS